MRTADRTLAEINKLSVELAALPFNESVELHALARLMNATGARVGWYSEYLPRERALALRHVKVEKGLLDRAVKLLGRRLEDVRSPVNAAAYEEILHSGVGYRKTISEISFGEISRPMSFAIQALLGTDRFAGLAHVMEGQLLGASVLGFAANQTDPPAKLLETGASVIAVALSRRRAELALRTTEDKYRIVFEGGVQGILVADAESRQLVQANAAVCAMFGYSAAELTRLRVDDIHPKASLDQVLASFAAQVRGDLALAAALPCLRKDGSVFLADVTASPLTLEGRACNVGFFLDVTERRRAEGERERLVTAVENAAESIVITDSAGSILYVNPTFEAMTGYPRDEVLGKNPRLLKSGEHNTEFYRALWDTITTGKTWRGRLVNRKKDGSLYTEEAAISPVRDANGAITSFVAVKRDISRDLDLQASYLQAQKMESVGRLAGGVAHDFNNLLSVIMGYTELALLMPQLNAKLRGYLSEVKKAGESATSLTRQLLAFSRRQDLKLEPLDLGEIAASLEKMLRRLIGEDIQLVMVRAPDLCPTAADRSQIEQVIMNLAVNARDAMPEGGKLVIETANAEIVAPAPARDELMKPGSYVVLSVTDTGCGIDAETQSHLFEPFFTTKESGKGTGLGLSTVYGIVRQSGGHIWVDSEVGVGTTFRIYLPRTADSMVVAVEPPRALSFAAGSETLLVVEDDDAVRGIARGILCAAGYEVLEAASGEDALSLAEHYRGDIHLMMTDVVMPKMTGKTLAERLASTRPGTKVLFTSGYTHHHFNSHTEVNFIAKPYSAAELARKIRLVLDQQMRPSPPSRPIRTKEAPALQGAERAAKSKEPRRS